MFPVQYWILFISGFALLISIDLSIIARNKNITRRYSLFLAFLYLIMLVSTAAMISYHSGYPSFFIFIEAYLIELILSIDNILIFIMIFQYLGISKPHQNRILFIGIVSAIFLRLIVVLFGVYLMNFFSWIFNGFGALLIYSGYSLLKAEKRQKPQPKDIYLIRIFYRFIHLTNSAQEKRFFYIKDRKLHITKIGMGLIMVEQADIIFALDSIPAVLSVTNNLFIVLTSNALATLGLRFIYSIVAKIISRFLYFKTIMGYAIMLVGIKMIFPFLTIDTLNYTKNMIILFMSSFIPSVVLYNKIR